MLQGIRTNIRHVFISNFCVLKIVLRWKRHIFIHYLNNFIRIIDIFLLQQKRIFTVDKSRYIKMIENVISLPVSN